MARADLSETDLGRRSKWSIADTRLTPDAVGGVAEDADGDESPVFTENLSTGELWVGAIGIEPVTSAV